MSDIGKALAKAKAQRAMWQDAVERADTAWDRAEAQREERVWDAMVELLEAKPAKERVK
jgi:hypothetical protein